MTRAGVAALLLVVLPAAPAIAQSTTPDIRFSYPTFERVARMLAAPEKFPKRTDIELLQMLIGCDLVMGVLLDRSLGLLTLSEVERIGFLDVWRRIADEELRFTDAKGLVETAEASRGIASEQLPMLIARTSVAVFPKLPRLLWERCVDNGGLVVVEASSRRAGSTR
jgi:hypothetical protein